GKLDYDWLTDAVDTTGAAFLGLTVGCARCHDHKFDPLSQKDYFALQAVFAASDLFDYRPDGTPLRGHVALKKTEKQYEQARGKSSRGRNPGPPDESPEIPLRGLGPRPTPLVVRLLRRGELNDPREVIAPALPARLAGSAISQKQPRTALADWIASARNALTAR